MNKLSHTTAMFIMFILILVIGYFGVYVQWNTLGQSRLTLNVTQAENDKLTKAKADVTAFLDNYQAGQGKVAMANKALPKGTADIPSILDSFSRMVGESGLNMTLFNINQGTPSLEPKPNTIKTIDLDIGASGTYEAFKAYLDRLQRNLRIVDVVSISVDSESGAVSSSQILKVSLKLRTYYQE
jgi:Tfp pilus assembly protein PilO